MLAVLAFTIPSTRADDDEERVIANQKIDTQEVEEARELFHLIRSNPELLNEREDLLPCEYPTRWSSDLALPEYIARDELGLAQHGDLIGSSDRSAALKDFLSASDKDALAFCEAKNADRIDADHLEGLPSSTDESMLIEHGAFAFPVFDPTFQKAVVVIKHSAMLFTKGNFSNSTGDASKVRRNPAQIVIFGAVFEKHDGHWRFTKTVPISVS